MGKRKRPFTSRKDPANLKRFRGIVQKFVGDSAESSLTTSFSDELFRGSERGSRAGRVSNLVRLRGVEPGKIKNRKTRRREERVLKKVKNSAFHQRKHVPSMEEYQKAKRTEAAERRKKKKAKSKQAAATELKQRKEENKVIEEKIDVRKQGLLEANKKDERIMKQLEKQMKMKKRQNLPKSFMDDGLDYILDAIDSNKLYSSYGHSSDEEEDFPAEHPFTKGRAAAEGDENSDEGSDDEDDRMVLDEASDSDDEQTESDLDESSSKNIAVVHSDKKSSRSILKSVNSKKTKVENLLKSVSFGIKKKVDDLKSDDVASDFSDSDSNNKSAVDSDSDSENEKIGDDETNVHNAYELKEDIYGRLRDTEGNIVTDNAQTTGAYVPPAKRLLLTGGDDSKRQQKLERLKKQLKGLVNRASEANIQPISSQIEEIYRTNSRADVSESLCSIIMEACVTTAMTPDRLVMELAMLLAILHGNVGQEVGACFIQNLSRRFEAVQGAGDGHMYGEGKEMDNIVSLFAHLYNFKVIHSQLVFDILKSFTESFGEKDIELILLLLKNVGFTLRKDDPSTLKDVIVAIQSKASSVDSSSFVDKSRVKFMLETIMAVRNNNMRKIPNYDPTHLEHLRKLIRGYVRGGKLLDNQLRISLADLLKAQESGRWWLVGSAWSGGLVDRQTDKQDETAIGRLNTILGTEAVSSSAILESARKQRMNTDTRKTIFCTIMASEDFVDAFEKLLRLGLKHKQERELVYVTVDCCCQQKHFNPFYAYLLQKFCEYDRRFQMTFQFHLWDKFSFLNQLSENNQKNLARLLTHLIANKAVSLSVLKTVEFGTLEKPMVRFLKQVLQGILLDYPDHVTVDVFTRIAPLTKLHLLREGLKLFMHHFLLKSKKAKEAEVDGVLTERVRLAEKALSSSGHGDTLL